MSVVWHDLECGAYAADLPLWRELAERHGDPVLDIGAGTGRVAIDLARHGHTVTALDADADLLEALSTRAAGLPVSTVVADARTFDLGVSFALCLVPMQTVQLLGGAAGRAAFLGCAQAHLRPGGLIAVAVVEAVDVYEELDGVPGPLPDMTEREGVVYASRPTAVRADAAGFVLERRRERIDPAGERTVEEDVVHLDALSAGQLEAEASALGLRPAGRVVVASTEDHVGSVVVMLGA